MNVFAILWADVLEGALRGAVIGAIVGGLIGAGVWAVSRLQKGKKDREEEPPDWEDEDRTSRRR